ncbi:MAG: metallopeptidase family protein [Peptoniphilus harei]|uniref:metallopeptidase family protein n=1 Tax=Peptoniphilus harei TaxID=54005 RepID=UPI00290A2CFF|nr:metallopeptidase family protein [Peptoniphilus harei]MDU5470381.1 metallopeptidase family protein [Peptoniphilus harei]MDU6097747.1 metallopeptidase family protein [Peptoniphilus harei]
MHDPDGRKIFYSDGENNFDLPLDLIEEIYEKNEDKIKLNSIEGFETPKKDKEEDSIDETFEDKGEAQEESKEDIGLKDEEKYDSYYLERIDEVEEILEDICESIPSYAFDHLNGGIILSEDKKYHEESRADDLLIMGEYQRSILGNMIKIYYGSFMEMYRFSSRERLKEKLEEVLLHEFTHHLEFLANEWGLVIEDKKFLEEYRKGKNNE